MNKTLAMMMGAAIAAGLIGCATQATRVASLRGADTASADLAPVQALAYAGKRPGSGAPIERSFREQPPLIPHAIDNFDEITGGDNQCLECHGVEKAAEKKAPQVAESHLAGRAGALRMERYQCNSCHVPQVDARPLVNNLFVGTPPARK